MGIAGGAGGAGGTGPVAAAGARTGKEVRAGLAGIMDIQPVVITPVPMTGGPEPGAAAARARSGGGSGRRQAGIRWIVLCRYPASGGPAGATVVELRGHNTRR